MTPDSAMQALYQPYHDILRANANRVVAKLSGSDLVPADEFRGIPQVHVQDTGISALFQQAAGAGGRPADRQRSRQAGRRRHQGQGYRL